MSLLRRKRPPGLERRRVVGYVLQVVERVDGGPLTPPLVAGMLLARYDVNANAGQGAAVWTADSREAHVFGSQAEALGAWMAVPRERPVAPDGSANRPLTAYTVEVREVLDR